MMPWACASRNCFRVGPVRRGTGSIPAACRICHTVEAAIGWPSLTSSPCTRRCPHVGFSVAIRITSLRIAASRCWSRGGAGGVGMFAVQLAAILGGHVTATGRSTDAGFVRDLGAERFISAGAGQPGPAAGGFDVVIDTVGGAVLDGSYGPLPGGRRLVPL